MTDAVKFLEGLSVGPPQWRDTVEWVPGLVCYKGPSATAVRFDGSLYSCRIDHIATDFAEDLEAGRWFLEVSAQLSEEGLAASAAAVAAAEATAEDAAATASDRTQTGLDRVATGQDKTGTAADRVATGQDRTATAADRVQTGLDRVATGQDSTATAADRVQTGSDRAAAATSATDAAAARDASIVNAQTYINEPTGRAAVADGATYDVQGTGDTAVLRYRRVNSGTVGTLIATFPSKGAVDTVTVTAGQNTTLLVLMNAALVKLGQAFQQYDPSATVVPLVADASGKILLGYDTVADSLIGVLTEETWRASLTSTLAVTTDTGPMMPIVSDASGKLLLYYNRSTDKIEGAGLASGGSTIQVARAAPGALSGLIFYGQSLAVGAQGTPVISNAARYAGVNKTFAGGPRAWNGSAYSYSPIKDLVEDSTNPAPDTNTGRGETCCFGTAQVLTTELALAGAAPATTPFLLGTAGHGGYSITQLEAGTSWWSNWQAMIAAAVTAGVTAFPLNPWIQGEQDSGSGGTLDRAGYLAKLIKLQGDMSAYIQQKTGQTLPAPLLTYQTAYRSALKKDIALAQLDAVLDPNTPIYMATPIYHLPLAGDYIHLTAAGYKRLGGYFGLAVAQMMAGREPDMIKPIGATRVGAVVTVKFAVGSGTALVLDNVNLPAATNYGFKVLDGASAATINSVAVVGTDKVAITLSAAPAGATTVRYALDYNNNVSADNNNGAGCLRDSRTNTIEISGSNVPLWCVAPHFELTAIPLEN